MKKIVAVILMIAMMAAVIPAAQADLTSEARSMLQMINDFRTGDNAWYWNRDNSTVTRKTGLGRLQYDEELEAVALVRAKELAERFDHIRPDGTDCFTAYPDNRETVGENIACGYRTAQEAFEGFLEEDEDYSGQGHRRIMLSSEITRVGIAAVDVNGTRYWAQAFASAPMKEADAPASTGQAGWEQNDGGWVYRKADGSLVTGWMQQDGKWFYLNQNGIMHTGWLEDGENWYFMNQEGVLQTGWVKDGGKRYYMNDAGEMEFGWQQIGGKWYFFESSGVMHTGWLKENGDWYYMNASGVMLTGTVNIDGSSEVFGADGVWKYTELQDYNTPLGTQSEAVRLIMAAVQQLIQNLFGAR